MAQNTEVFPSGCVIDNGTKRETCCEKAGEQAEHRLNIIMSSIIAIRTADPCAFDRIYSFIYAGGHPDPPTPEPNFGAPGLVPSVCLTPYTGRLHLDPRYYPSLFILVS